jgi:hypothetical protein
MYFEGCEMSPDESFIIIIISLFSVNPIESTSHGCGNRPGYITAQKYGLS